MSFIYLFLSLAFFSSFPSIYASIYVIEPPSIQVCHGGQPCTFQWIDDGKAPLLNDIGTCHVALYNGEEDLVQQIKPVDVSTVHFLQFNPNPMAGPNSDQYYINFTSVDSVAGAIYSQATSFFQLDQMSGSLQSPIPSLTALIPVSSSHSPLPLASQSMPEVSYSPSPSSSSSQTALYSSQTSSPIPPSSTSSANGTTATSQSSSHPESHHRFAYIWITYCFVVLGFIQAI